MVFDLQLGEGSLAEPGFALEYHFIMWRSDSSLVNSSFITGRPQIITLGQDNLIEGWEEGLNGMRAGGFRQLKIPPELAYGSSGSESLGIAPDETIFMELALLNVGIHVEQNPDG